MITLKGRWVFDSNLFIYTLDKGSPFHLETKKLFSLLQNGLFSAVVAQQNIIEAHRIMVSLYRQDRGKSIQDIINVLNAFKIDIITPYPSTFMTYQQLLPTAGEKIDVFDYYLAATMIDNKVFKILTVNEKDFRRIKDITAVNPFDAD